jgi:hypothetical protein
VVRGTLALVALLLTVAVGSAFAAEKQAYPISFHAFAFAAGTTAGTKVDKGALVLGSGLTATTYADRFGYAPRDYRAGTWTSPWKPAGFPSMELCCRGTPTPLPAPSRTRG